MSKPLSIACKAVGATVIIGAFVLVACLFSESSRTMSVSYTHLTLPTIA